MILLDYIVSFFVANVRSASQLPSHDKMVNFSDVDNRLSARYRIRNQKKQILSLVLLSLLLPGEVARAGSRSLRFPKHDVTIDLKIPARWEGPAYTAWPSYETWSFVKKDSRTKSYLQIRIDPLKPGQLDWNLATNAEVRKAFDDFADPEIERIAKIEMENTPVLVWAAYDVDGQLLMAEVRWGELKISFELRAERRAELRRYKHDFLDVLRSVRILAKER